MKKFDIYQDLCTQAYDLSKPKPPEEAYAFYRSYVEQAKGDILEPMCGTGRFLIPLLQEGFKIDGFNASAHMLDVLYEKANYLKLKPNVWQAFAQDLSEKKRYSLIFIPSGSFGLITDPDDIMASLKIFHEHLTDEGVFVFEGETKQAIPPLDIWQGSKWSRPDGKTILLSSCISLEDNIYSALCKYELIEDNRITQTEIEEYKIRIYDPNVLTAMLKQAGFKQIKTIKAFDQQSIPNNQDESIVYECTIQ